MGTNFNYKRPSDTTISTTETEIGPIDITGLKDINLYLVNAGSQELFYEVLGSPSGAQTGTTDAQGNAITDAIVARESKSIRLNNIAAGDKELLPMIQFKLKTIVQDVRSLSVKGKLLQAIQTTVSRVEQYVENEQGQKRKGFLNPY